MYRDMQMYLLVYNVDNCDPNRSIHSTIIHRGRYFDFRRINYSPQLSMMDFWKLDFFPTTKHGALDWNMDSDNGLIVDLNADRIFSHTLIPGGHWGTIIHK